MTPETRDTALRVLRAALDTILSDIHMDSGWYAKYDWRGDLHRKSTAVEMRALRRAIRELRPTGPLLSASRMGENMARAWAAGLAR